MGAAVGRREGGPRGPGGPTKHGRKAATPAGAPTGRSAEACVQRVGSGQGCWWEGQAGCIRGQAGSQEARARQWAALTGVIRTAPGQGDRTRMDKAAGLLAPPAPGYF